MTHESDYLTVAEAAELLKVSRNTLRRAINRGDIPIIRLGDRTRRIRRTDLHSLTDTRSTDAD